MPAFSHSQSGSDKAASALADEPPSPTHTDPSQFDISDKQLADQPWQSDQAEMADWICGSLCFMHEIKSASWHDVLDDRLAQRMAHILATHTHDIWAYSSYNGQADMRFQVSIAWSDDADIQALNSQFRSKDKPTNVLSFPDDSFDPETGAVHLGDIILSFETMKKEADISAISLGDHTTHLLLHGLLHLLGYDHIAADEALEMESLETKILTDLGLANPYEQPLLAAALKEIS